MAKGCVIVAPINPPKLPVKAFVWSESDSLDRLSDKTHVEYVDNISLSDPGKKLLLNNGLGV